MFENQTPAVNGAAARRSPLDEGGAVAAEYALLISCIALVIFAAVVAFGGGVHGLFQQACASAPFNC
jgi:Flp pilus assembly pilin Flp